MKARVKGGNEMIINRTLSNGTNIRVELTDNEMEQIYDIKRKYKKIEKELDICLICGAIEKNYYESLRGNHDFYDMVIEIYQKMNVQNRFLTSPLMMLNTAIHMAMNIYKTK